MKVTVETLAAVYRLAKHLAHADGEVKDSEVQEIFKFFRTFEGIDTQLLGKIVEHGTNGMDDTQAVLLIRDLDPEAKQGLANLFAKIICADSELTEEEKNLYFQIQEVCGLPDPQDESEEAEPEPEPAGQEEEDSGITPAFIVVKSNGITRIEQSEHEDWATLGDELASWINAGRVEVVRFTRPLNALTEKLRLNERHLVFMVDRNGYANPDAGDNMPGTILYGSGYEIMGDIVFALETDKGYEIEGIMSKSLLGEVLEAINEAVDGLLRVE